MARFSTRSLALAALCAVTPAFTVLNNPPVENVATALDGHEALEEAMHGLVDGMKALSKSIGDPASNAASLATLVKMQGHALAAKELAPTNLDETPEKERDALKLAYRADMSRLLQELCAMEIEVCEGENDKAKARVRGKLIPLRNSSHEKYQPK